VIFGIILAQFAYAGFLLGFLFHPEDVGNIFIRNELFSELYGVTTKESVLLELLIVRFNN
jgi:hypothetical protein